LNKKLQIIIIFGLFFLIANIGYTVKSVDDSENILTLQEGMKYEYLYEFYDDRKIEEIYITKNTMDAWEGIGTFTDLEDNTTYIYKFKISKQDLRLYATDNLKASKIFDERVKPRLIKKGDPGYVIPFFPIIYNRYDIESMLKNKTSFVHGGTSEEEIYRVEAIGPIEYKNFSCYKLTLTLVQPPFPISYKTELYVSVSPPYLLITQYYKPANEEIKIHDLRNVEKATFDVNKYNIKKDFNDPPGASFIYTVNDFVVQFNSTSYDPDGYITNYTWDFGDGNISYEQNPVHKYARPGRYKVTLRVKDDEGTICSFDSSQYINVPPYFIGEDNKSRTNYTQEEEKKPPDIIIVNITYPKKVKPNQDFKINITIKNKGSEEIFWGDVLEDGVKTAEIPLSGHLMILEGQNYTTNLTLNISKITEFTVKVGHYNGWISEQYKVIDDVDSFTITCENNRAAGETPGFELLHLVTAVIFLVFLCRVFKK